MNKKKLIILLQNVIVTMLFSDGCSWVQHYITMKQGKQAPVVWSLAKLLRKIYPNDEEYKALDNHFNYFNTTTAMANIILGATTAMEERMEFKLRTQLNH